MMKYPQYAKTTASDVIETISANKAGEQEVRDRAFVFAKAHGGEYAGWYASTFFGYRVNAIECAEKPKSGRWTTGTKGRGWRPYVNNPLWEEFESLVFHPEPVRGIPGMLHSGFDSEGRARVGHPTVFVLDGVAWSGTLITPTDDMPDDSPWVEVKASEFHAALETYNERLAENGGEK